MRELLARARIPLMTGLLALVSAVTIASERGAPLPRERAQGGWSSALLEIAVPVQKALGLPVRFVRDAWSRYVVLGDLRTENDRLRVRIAELEEENLQFREALVASDRLRSITEMRERFATPMRPAAVVGRDLSPWFRSVLIDRGHDDGVVAGMPVVAERGVAGLVTATAPHAARAMLLLDRQSAIDGVVQRSRARGIVRGRGTERLEFVFAVRGDDVRVGDVVITSGLGGAHPKALRIGEVVRVSAEETRLLHTAQLKPAVDFGRLEQVFVMFWRGPTLKLLYDGAPASAPEPESAP